MITIPLFEDSQFPKSKIKKSLYHGTNNKKFVDFDKDYDYEAHEHGRVRDFELPYGVIYLTDDIDSARGYGSKILKVDVNCKKLLTIDVGSNSPDRSFDDDYNNENKMWSKFEDGGYDVLQVKGENRDGKPRSIYITYPELVKVHKDG
jgi:hypothetical protein